MKFKKTTGLSAAIAAAAISASIAPTASAEIELGNGLSVTGFIDMSYQYVDEDGATDESANSFAVDQVETDFIYIGTNGISAQVDIEYGESGDGSGTDETFVEQAFITKQVTDKFSIKGGRFLSYSGWETEEPTGLYQYSAAGYADLFYGFYQQGVSGFYDGESVDVMVSLVNDAFAPTATDRESVDVEVGVAFQPAEGFTTKLFYISNEEDDLINFWTSYAVSNWIFAFEYNMRENEDDSEADGFLLMANLAVGNWGFTGRYVDYSMDNGAGTTTREQSSITFAPSYKVGDNLLLVGEVRVNDGGDVGPDSNALALEALFTF